MRILITLISLFALFANAKATVGADDDFNRMMAASDESSLPLVNITTDIESVTKEKEIAGTLEIYDLKARTEGQQYFKTNCRVKYRGSSSLSYDKKSFAIKPTDANDEKVDVNIFGIREDDSWILDAMAIDRIRMRNRLCFDLWNEISHTPYETDYGNRNGTLGVYVELFVNGNYHGLYCMTDKINRKLLGLKKAKENEEDNTVTIRGLLFKGNSWTPATALREYDATQPLDTDMWNGWELQYPDDYPCAEVWQPLMDFIDLFQLSASTLGTRYGEYLYKKNLTDYCILILALNYGDCAMKNTFLSTVNIENGHQYLITPWDMDMSLGGYYDGQYNDVLCSINQITDLKLFYALYSYNIDGFKDGVAEAWKELSQTTFSIENVFKRIDDYAEAFVKSGAWEREYDKWNNNPVALTKDINEELSYVKDWYARNYQHLSDLLGVETGIRNVDTADGGDKGMSYTLDGMMLPADGAYRGLIIRNGKKMFLPQGTE